MERNYKWGVALHINKKAFLQIPLTFGKKGGHPL